MRQGHLTVGRAGAVAVLALAAGVAWAKDSGQTSSGWAYVSGGATYEEQVELHAARRGYSLWVVTAARKSGAYLADVQVHVRDAAQREVFDRALDGPWLFLDLPPGAYTVEAVLGGQTQRGRTTIHRGDHHQLFLYFDVDEQVGEDQPTVADPPYGGVAR